MEDVRLPSGRKVGWIIATADGWDGYSFHNMRRELPFQPYPSREAAIAAMTADTESYDAHRTATKVPRTWGKRRGHGGQHLWEHGAWPRR